MTVSILYNQMDTRRMEEAAASLKSQSPQEAVVFYQELRMAITKEPIYLAYSQLSPE